MKTGVQLIADERQRQIDQEGWSLDHDSDTNGNEELAFAAAVYATPEHERTGVVEDGVLIPDNWPEDWDASWYKPGDRIRELQKAGALIAAEIDRLQNL